MITLSVYELRTSLLHCPKTQEGLIPSARPQFHFVKRPFIRGVVSQQRVYVATVRRHLSSITKVPIEILFSFLSLKIFSLLLFPCHGKDRRAEADVYHTYDRKYYERCGGVDFDDSYAVNL